MTNNTYEQLHAMHTEALKDHHLEAVQDLGPVKAWYLRRAEGRCMSTLITFNPEGIVVMGDFCPNQSGAISTFGYGLKWFVGELPPDYLAEKFLPKAYHEDDAEEWFRYELEQVNKAIDPPFDNQDGLDDADLLVRREALQAMLDGGEFHECAVMDEWQSIAVDCEDFPSYTYARGDKALLSAIQQRFAALFWERYERIDEDGESGGEVMTNRHDIYEQLEQLNHEESDPRRRREERAEKRAQEKARTMEREKERIAKLAGKPYRPSNGSEGECFQAQWCEECERDAAYRRGELVGGWEAEGCSILAATMCFNVDDPDYPKEWVFCDRGWPVCTAYVEIGKPTPDPPDPRQLPLFEEK